MSEQGPQDVRHDPAVPVIGGFARSVDPNSGLELPIISGNGNGARSNALVQGLHTGDSESLLSGKAERLRVFTIEVLQRQHAHADEIRSMDPFVRLGENSAHSEQSGALGRPVPR